MKTKWITPRTEIEAFVPDEYIAVCWGVRCNISAANAYEATHGPYGDRGPSWADLKCTHDGAHCGRSSNQVVQDTNNDGIADGMTEIGTDGLGTLECTVYTDATYSIIKSISEVGAGSYIYWTTAAGNKIWHHQGQVIGTDATCPNAS